MTNTNEDQAPVDMQALLVGLLDTLTYVHPDDVDGDLSEAAELLDGASVSTYNEAGVLTLNQGLVLTLADGSEYQLTIVRSR